MLTPKVLQTKSARSHTNNYANNRCAPVSVAYISDQHFSARCGNFIFDIAVCGDALCARGDVYICVYVIAQKLN